MTDWGPGPVGKIFAGLVPDEVAAAYEKLLDADGVAEDNARAFLGGDDAVRILLDLGMARVFPATSTRPASLSAVGPELALQGVLADLQSQVLRTQQLVLEGTRRSASAHGRRSVNGTGPAHLVEIITDRDEIMRVSSALINSARTDWMTFETINSDTQLNEQSIINAPKALGDRICRRSIYDRPFMDDRVGRRVIEKCVAAGEEARIRPRIQMKMQLADTSAVLLPLTITGTGGAMLIHAEPVVAGMREFFELAWERAAPVGGAPKDGSTPLTKVQQQVLGLLAQGYQDNQIARQVGISNSSVRRHITAIEKRLEAKTRFEAGVTAHRLGWID